MRSRIEGARGEGREPAPSRARGASQRRAFELGCRLVAFGLLMWTLYITVRREGVLDSTPPVVVRGETLARDLPSLAIARRGPLHVEFGAGGGPDAVQRAWLRAIARSGAGRAVTWSGASEATALAVEPLAQPTGGIVISAAGGAERVLRFADDAGPIDSVRVRRGGVELRVPALEGSARLAATGAPTAANLLLDSIALREVLVLGRPSWETRFVAAALEEAGWRVALRTPVGPGQVVQQGAATLDTARVGVIIALDSTAAEVAEVVGRFVRSGGGLIATSAAVRDVPAIAALAAGASGLLRAPSLATVGDSVTPRDLPLAPIVSLRADAVVLERRDGAVALAARRLGAGRVAQLGYAESWRWRLSGGDSGTVAHRRWWSTLVSSVAHVSVVPRDERPDDLDPAPLAATIEALGPSRPRPEGTTVSGASQAIGAPVAFTLILLLLLTEWFSRRLRGAR